MKTQENEITPPSEVFYRKATLEHDTSGKDDRRVRLAFSSEEPVNRFFGVEVLDHKPESVNLTVLKSGRAPVLVNHNPDDHIGVVEQVSIGSDRVGRATVRFGKSVRADDVLHDIRDSIRLNVSVGYRVNKMVREEDSEGQEIFRITNWTPMEISIVSIPADAKVGVGRDERHLRKGKPMENKVITTDQADPKQEKRAEKKREGEIQNILAIGKRFGQSDVAIEAVNEGLTLEQFQKRMLESLPSQVSISSNPNHLGGYYGGQAGDFNITRAVSRIIENKPLDGLESEISDQIARDMNKRVSGSGFFVPSSALFKRTTMTVGTDAEGGHLKGTDHRPDFAIDLLSNSTLVKDLGATVLTGLVGDQAIPKLISGVTAAWVAEGSKATESNLGFAQVSLSPKQVTANCKYTRKLLVQSNPSIETLVRDDIQRQLGLAIDLGAINGSGASNQPTGILNTSGIGAVADADTNGGAITWDKVVDLTKEVDIDNALVGSLSYMANAKVMASMRKTVRVASTDSQFILDGPDLLGYKIGNSNQVPSNLTKGTGTNLSAMIFGNFADLLIGEWGAIEVIVDPYTEADLGNVRIAAHAFVDIGVRHAQSFAAIQDIVA